MHGLDVSRAVKISARIWLQYLLDIGYTRETAKATIIGAVRAGVGEDEDEEAVSR